MHLVGVVERSVPLLTAIAEPDAARRPAPGKWSKKEILGHLVDSAANNHQRFVRLQLQPEINLPGYDQDGWVRLNRYQHKPWPETIALWSAYNRHLVSVIESLDDSALGHVWHSPEGDVTLEFIASDYVRHLKHHLAQIGIQA
jgi:hypothetical protein